MKKPIITKLITVIAAASMIITLSACGQGPAENGGRDVEPIPSSGVSETENSESEVDTNPGTSAEVTGAEVSVTEPSNASGSDSSSAGTDASNADGQTESQENGNNNASDPYEAFMSGSAKAKYRGTGDRTSYLETSVALQKGKSYTMDEIVEALENLNEYVPFKLSSEVRYFRIDCGSDGNEEMLVEAMFDPEYTLYMVIKEIDGELAICYTQDGWSRSDVVVHDDGTIDGSGSGGANVFITDKAFVNADGEYRFFYGCEETMSLFSEIYVMDGSDYKTFMPEGLGIDQEHTGIRDYYFEPVYEDRKHYYMYFIFDDTYADVTTDADYDDSNGLKQKFAEAGAKTYTQKEIDELLQKRAKEIGYPGSVN